MKKRVLLMLLLAIVIMQFFRPERNSGKVYGVNDITKTLDVPDDIKNILERSCNDCHSNNTYYPWYTNIQPLGWWLNHHVVEGKDELNFSEFSSYKLKRKLRKLKEIAEQVKTQEMPLGSYLWVHREARLSEVDQEKLANWALATRASLDTTKMTEEKK